MQTKINIDATKTSIADLYCNKNGVMQYFEIEENFLKIIRSLYVHKILSSFLFGHFLKHTYSTIGYKNDQLDHDCIMEDIVQPTLTLLRTEITTVLNGTVGLNTVVKLFAKHTNKFELVREFEILTKLLQLSFHEEDLRICASKICCVFQLKHCVKMANKILRVAEKLQLQGNFKDVNEIRLKVYFYPTWIKYIVSLQGWTVIIQLVFKVLGKSVLSCCCS